MGRRGHDAFTLASGRLAVHKADNAQQVMIRAATTPAASFTSVMPDAAPLLAEVIDRALAFEKSERWSGAAAMREALRTGAKVAFGSAPTAGILAGILEELGDAAVGRPSVPRTQASSSSVPAAEDVPAFGSLRVEEPERLAQPLGAVSVRPVGTGDGRDE